MPPRHQPINSKPARETSTDKEWLDVPYLRFRSPQPIRSRREFLKHLVMETKTRSSAGGSIANFVAINAKGLWDGDPEKLVVAAESVALDFFASHPNCPDSGAMEWKKALVGRLSKVWFRDGLSAHGKPNLRN